MDLNFSQTFQYSFSHIKKNSINYIKTDFKYLLLLSISYITAVIVIPLSVYLITNLSSDQAFLLLIFFFIIGSIGWLILFNYLTTWLLYSKSLHLFKLFQKHKSNYKVILEETKIHRMRMFWAVILRTILIMLPLILIYILFILGLVLLVSNGNRFSPIFFLIFFLGLSLIIMGIGIVSGILFIPLSLYPLVLLIDNDLGYIEGIKKCYQIVRGWKSKLKFFALQFIYNMMINFVIQFLLIGILVFSFFGILILIIFLQLDSFGILFVLITGSVIVIIILISITAEGQSITMGSLYGQVFVSFTQPEHIHENEKNALPEYIS